MNKYILGLDQSTQGTKAILFNEAGAIVKRVDIPHRQIVNEQGWVSHDPSEIYRNLLAGVRQVIHETGIDKSSIQALGISNQRETTVMWDNAGNPLANAVVWQCARAAKLAERFEKQKDEIYAKTGLPLSPYFPACKMAWLLENTAHEDDIRLGTIDSWLIYKLTNGESFKTDYSNASRTQLFNLHTLSWDEELCQMFGIPLSALPQVCSGDSCFGYTDFEGLLDLPIPIHAVLGDSHAALYGQGCHKSGMVKATYGTGSSIMMNIGDEYRRSISGLATSLAWKIGDEVNFVLEGNINYTGAVITWLKDNVGIIAEPSETEALALKANPSDNTVLVPAFSGLGAPYWSSDVKAVLYGMTRTTGKAEIVRAGLESIAYQVNDVLSAMQTDFGRAVAVLRVDGGPTKNNYLMQFQSDLSNVAIHAAKQAELSAMGVAYLAGISLGMYRAEELFGSMRYNCYEPSMREEDRSAKQAAWAFAAGFAVLAAQYANRKIDRVSMWEREVQEIENKYPKTRKNEIIFYGASNFAYWKQLDEDFSKLKVQNHSFGGSMDIDLVAFAERLLFPFEPSMVVFQTGSNDYVELEGSDAEKIEHCMKYKEEMFTAFHERLPKAHFVVLSGLLLPGRQQFIPMTIEINKRLKALCDNLPYMHFADVTALTYNGDRLDTSIFRDSLHLNHEGELQWRDGYILPCLEAIINEHDMKFLRKKTDD